MRHGKDKIRPAFKKQIGPQLGQGDRMHPVRQAASKAKRDRDDGKPRLHGSSDRRPGVCRGQPKIALIDPSMQQTAPFCASWTLATAARCNPAFAASLQVLVGMDKDAFDHTAKRSRRKTSSARSVQALSVIKSPIKPNTDRLRPIDHRQRY
jgi:hypothetical protein